VLFLIVTVLLAAGAVTLGARALLLPRLRASAAVGRISAYGYSGDDVAADEVRAPVHQRISESIGRRLLANSTEEQQAELRRLLLGAGAWTTTPEMLTGYRLFSAVLLSVALLWLGAGSGFSPVLLLAGAGYAAYAGWKAPLVIVKSRASQRIERIELELPELIDLLVVTLESGLAFNSAMQRSADRMQGPLAEELQLTLREQSLGLTLQDALGNMLDRCDAPAVRAFVRSVSQGEAMGISIGDVMRELAGDLRDRRRQIVQEKAQKAPIKILFPLATLILPVTLFVVLFPGIYKIIHTLANGGL